jgi:hypothetical protein
VAGPAALCRIMQSAKSTSPLAARQAATSPRTVASSFTLVPGRTSTGLDGGGDVILRDPVALRKTQDRSTNTIPETQAPLDTHASA